ncbi:M16 family metallopeptidase [Amorphus orientalis]|uniref:Zinc protease n=1 Tax=Amorphus orientalis TaxID=649198 RepID=A0AAE4ATD7_9HYPH|nr:pitrilysin family protein [Amorphus orientalis]MDQ0316168.1 zinc protease [Amorphus orientalis]
MLSGFSDRIRSCLLATGFTLAASLGAASSSAALTIEPVTSPGGITAWLVEDDTVPVVVMKFAFEGAGAVQDPEDKPGVANLLSTLLDEGAGPYDSEAFQTELQDRSVRLSFDSSRDSFYGDLEMLADDPGQGIELLRLALTEPHFDAEPIERMRAQIISGIRRDQRDPSAVASDVWSRTAYPDHPYGRPSEGTEESVAAIEKSDLEAFKTAGFARDNLHVVVVGAIDAETLKPLLDDAFGDLPETADLKPVADVMPVTGQTVTETMDVPQTAVRFGGPGLARSDPEFIPAFVMNHILGGGTFSSRLFEEIREKRGLAYSVYTYLAPLDHTAIFGGGTATRADRVDETVRIIREEIARMAEEGPTEEELSEAKAYLTGAYPLRFDSSNGIASQLLSIQMEDLGMNYVDERNGLIEAVTIEDVRQAAERVLGGDAPTIVTVGPSGA